MKKYILFFFCSIPLFAVSQEKLSIDNITGSFDLFTQVLEERFDVKIFYKKEWINHFDKRIDILGESVEEVLNNTLQDTDLGYLKYSESNYIIAPSDELSEVLSLDYVLVKERFAATELAKEIPLLYIGDSSLMGLITLDQT